MPRQVLKPQIYVLEKDNFFVTKVSTNTIDKYTDVVFLRAKTRISPIEKKNSYKDEILKLKREFVIFFEKTIRNNPIYEDNFIFTVTVAEESVKYNKTTHLHYDLFVKSKKKNTLLYHKNKLEKISDKLDKKLISLFKKYSLKWY